MIKNISNLGDAALYCDFGDEVNKEINSQVIKYFRSLKGRNIEGVTNLTPSYNKLIISFDLNKTNFREIKKLIENENVNEIDKNFVKKIEIPTCCEDIFALDIKRLEFKLSLKREKIYESFFEISIT